MRRVVSLALAAPEGTGLFVRAGSLAAPQLDSLRARQAEPPERLAAVGAAAAAIAAAADVMTTVVVAASVVVCCGCPYRKLHRR